MDFNAVLTTFLNLECGSSVAVVYAGSESSQIIQNILIYIPKMGKYFLFLGELSP